MKIDNTGKPAGVFSTPSKPVKRESDSSETRSSDVKSENVAINPLASQLSSVDGAVAAAPAPFDKAKVESIKAAIAKGEFNVNPGKIADGLISSARELLSRGA